MTETATGWETDHSSGYLTNFTGVVSDAYFATNPRVNQGETLMMNWDVQIDEDSIDEGAGPEGGEINQQYSCGSDWTTEDGGRTAEHPRRKPFHASSIYGKIIDSITGTLDGYGDNATDTETNEKPKTALADAFEVLQQRGAPTNAEVWKGTRWRFGEVLFDYGEDKKDKDAAEREKRAVVHITSRRSVPIEFLGVAGDAKADPPAKAEATSDAASKTAAAKARAKAKKEAAKETPAEDVDQPGRAAAMLDTVPDLEAGLKAQIVTLLATHGDFSSWQDACLELDGVPENDALVELLIDDSAESLWGTKAGV